MTDGLAVAYERVMARTMRRRSGPVINGKRCLEWQGSRTKAGYGNLRLGKRVVYVHRVVDEHEHGRIPDGVEVGHHCDNPPCVETVHHFRCSHTVNIRDMALKGRGQTKLDPERVREIRAAAAGGDSFSAIGRRFCVSNTLVGRIVRRERWTWVD